jgi:hypothetical protein
MFFLILKNPASQVAGNKNVKKIMMTLVFLMICAAPILAKPTLIVKIEVVIGKKSEGCYHNGICYIIVTVKSTKQGIAGLSYVDDNDNLIIDLLTEDERVLKDERLAGEFFIIEEDVELPPNMLIGLGLKDTNGIIKPGKYPIEHKDDRLSINFGAVVN